MANDLQPPPWPEPLGPRLGAGGFASVWELPKGKVLKIAHASTDLARARIAREAEALTAIGAPWVPHCHATGVLADGRAWIVMDRIDGATLDKLAARGPQPATEIVPLATKLLEAIEHVHDAGFVHRDLKPANAVVTGDGRVVVLDLGLARKLPEDPDDPTRANVQVGSVAYLPPEQLADSASVDRRSDLYAFGCVLYELLAGRPPFVGDAAALERAHAALRPPRLGALVAVPAGLEALCMDCLAKDRARRPESAAIARARLGEARDEPSNRPHTMSMIREGKQPVVLVWAELPKVDRALLAVLAARKLVVASQRGRRVLAGVVGGEHADPASVAIAVARELAAAGARVALHLDALRVESAAGAITLHGDAIDHPERWLPAEAWTGVVLTRALAAVTQAATRAIDGSELRALADEQAPVELLGRDALLVDLIADAGAAISHGPAFALVFGEAGVGKTAFAAELARRLAQDGTRVVLGSVPAPGTGRPPHTALAELIDTPAPGMSVVRWVGDALRAAARRQPLAVILDDLHLADHELLDALEYATLGGEALPLWVLGVASPRLDTRRPQLASRAERHRRDVLPPLDEDAAVALAAALLRPAEYPPLRALRRLAAIAHGNPLHLALLAREIHERGAVRSRPGGAPFLDTTALDDLQPAALGPWLAARELAPLSAELVALARVCAVLGGDIARGELGAIVEAVERHGGATTTIDVDIGLGELVRAGVLAQASDDGHYRFCQPLVEEGIYATTDERERLAVHEAALAHWRGGDSPERIARHAEAVGAREVAAEAYARLGARAQAESRMLDADQEWTGAVRNLDAQGSARGRALLGRARARYGQQRVKDALADLADALACAEAAGDAGLEIDVLLERATVLDWADDYAASAASTARARERLPAAPTAERALELQLAAGREAFRRAMQGSGRYDDAIEPLRAAMRDARALGRGDVFAIAGVLLGPALAWIHDPSAEALFAEVIASCEARDDRLHLGAAFANRAWLWNASGELDRFADDMRRCIQLSREIGQASLERAGTYNLGENLLWQAKLDEALSLARRCLAIQQAHGEGSTQPDRLLLGRVLAARGDRDELARLLATFADETLAAEDEAVVASLRAVLDAAVWPAALEAADALAPQLRIELALLALRVGRLDPERRAALHRLAADHPIWKRRASEL